MIGSTSERDFNRLVRKFTIGDECWEWTGAKNSDGYGRIHWCGRLQPAHRVVHELLVGAIGEGLVLDHLCRNPGCVNPKHLEPVTHQLNLKRGVWPQSQVTHCPQGHPYAGSNLACSRDGKRRCSACRNAQARARYAARKGSQITKKGS